MERLTFKEFARRIGVHQSQVTLAVRYGRITAEVDGEKRKFLYFEKAHEEWKKNTSAAHSEAGKIGSKIKHSKPQSVETTPATYTESRAKREGINAQKAELELEEKMGKLVKVELVQEEAFKFFRNVRDMLLNVPDRVAPEFAAEQNQFKIHTRLTQEIRRTLEEIAEKYDKAETSEPEVIL